MLLYVFSVKLLSPISWVRSMLNTVAPPSLTRIVEVNYVFYVKTNKVLRNCII